MADAQTHIVTAQQEQNRPQGVTRESLVVSPCLTQESLIVSPCFLLSEEGRKEEKSSIRLAGGWGERGVGGRSKPWTWQEEAQRAPGSETLLGVAQPALQA